MYKGFQNSTAINLKWIYDFGSGEKTRNECACEEIGIANGEPREVRSVCDPTSLCLKWISFLPILGPPGLRGGGSGWRLFCPLYLGTIPSFHGTTIVSLDLAMPIYLQ